jgi:hypothetical protein
MFAIVFSLSKAKICVQKKDKNKKKEKKSHFLVGSGR